MPIDCRVQFIEKLNLLALQAFVGGPLRVSHFVERLLLVCDNSWSCRRVIVVEDRTNSAHITGRGEVVVCLIGRQSIPEFCFTSCDIGTH